jgi:hypothetical protein
MTEKETKITEVRLTGHQPCLFTEVTRGLHVCRCEDYAEGRAGQGLQGSRRGVNLPHFRPIILASHIPSKISKLFPSSQKTSTGSSTGVLNK